MTLAVGTTLAVSGAALGQDLSALAGRWESDTGQFSLTLKVVDGRVEGETDSPTPTGRRIAGEIRNFKLEGDQVTFEAVYFVGRRRVGPPTATNRYVFKVIDATRMEGKMTRDDGSGREIILLKKE